MEQNCSTKIGNNTRVNRNMFINIFDNSYTEGICGGNVRCVQIFKNIRKFDSGFELRLVGSKKCQASYRDFGLFEGELITSEEKEVTNFYWTYFCRLCKLSFWSLAGRFKKQIIYANSDYLVDVLPAFFSKIFYKTVWIQVSQLIIDHPKKRENSFSNYIAWFFQRIAFLLMKKADLVITDGYAIKDVLISKFNFSSQLVKVGFLGVDPQQVVQAMPAKRVNDLIFAGTLDKRKGVGDFINICKRLADEGIFFKATVIGGKSDQIRALQIVTGRYGISGNINFSGVLEQKDVFSYLKNSKIFLFPSYNESWGLVICEAIICGALPLVRELNAYKKIYEDNVIYCNSVQDFYKKTKFYLENDDLRRQLVQKAKEFIKRYSWEKVAQREKGFINSALNN